MTPLTQSVRVSRNPSERNSPRSLASTIEHFHFEGGSTVKEVESQTKIPLTDLPQPQFHDLPLEEDSMMVDPAVRYNKRKV